MQMSRPEQSTKDASFYSLDSSNSINAIMLTIIWWEYMYIWLYIYKYVIVRKSNVAAEAYLADKQFYLQRRHLPLKSLCTE
jgi:hypothetical protein